MTRDDPADDILDSIEPAPMPARTVPTGHRPPLPFLTGRAAWLELLAVALLSMLLAASVTAWWLGPGASPSPASAATLGRAFAPALAASLADGFDAAAESLHGGKSLAEADKALKASFHDAAEGAFETRVGPAVTAIIPDGSDITSQAQRDALEAFHRGFAQGLRNAR